ncbi:hypothetical protein [Rhizobium sp. M10]|uniref:hypothetical protein n=1 Tax=Rhizobium sp. M10 TaxID=1324586 RepID=UPI0011415529|nr:hypothetical protein [Rhizobium sp. M10]
MEAKTPGHYLEITGRPLPEAVVFQSDGIASYMAGFDSWIATVRHSNRWARREGTTGLGP